ncbi:MAG TPA: glutathione S-transferase family protein [Stellaceae bacterium]|nr:glutathione S-transferase family protein [Stellaceae bacterium]
MQAQVVQRSATSNPPASPAMAAGRGLSAKQKSAIALHRFGPYLGTPDSSPFVIKVMILMKLAGLSFREVVGNPFKAPRSFLPYIVDDGVTVPDSSLIRAHLERKYGVDFDAGLDPVQKAEAWAIERMCEDHLYFAMLESRWLDPRIFREGLGKHMFGPVPAPVRPMVKGMLRRMNAKRLAGHGLGRHAKADITALARRDIDALATLIGEKPCLMGEKPCGADAFVFGIVTAILTPPIETPLRAAMAAHANLVAYRDRLTRQFFPDLAASR